MLRYCLYVSIGIMQMPDNQVICKSLSTKYALKNRHSKTAQTERCKHYPQELIAQAHRRSIGGWHSPRKLTLSKGRTPTFALRLRTPVGNALLHVRAPTTEHCRRGVKDMPQRLQDGAAKAWVVVKERVQTIHVRTVRFMMFHGIVSRWGEYLLLLLFAPWPSCLFHVFNRLSWPICHARNVRCDDVIQKGASAWAHSKTRSWYWNRCIITTFDPKASSHNQTQSYVCHHSYVCLFQLQGYTAEEFRLSNFCVLQAGFSAMFAQWAATDTPLQMAKRREEPNVKDRENKTNEPKFADEPQKWKKIQKRSFRILKLVIKVRQDSHHETKLKILIW